MTKDKRIRRKIIFLIFFVVVFIVLAALLFTGRRFNVDALLRTFAYMRDEKDDQGQLAELKFVSTAGSAYADYEGGIAVASVTGLEIIARDGDTVVSHAATLASPAIKSSGNRVLVYDLGGTTVLCYKGGKNILDLRTDETVISAEMNPDGWIALTTGESGYKALITVYDPDMEVAYKYYSSTAYAVCAAVDPGNGSMTVAAVVYDDAGFRTKLMRFDFDSETARAEGYLDDCVPLALRAYSASRLCVVTESAVCFLDDKLAAVAQYDFGSAYLKDIDLAGDDGPVLFLGEQRTGTKSKVVALSKDGEVLAESEVTSELLDISSAGGYIAMLYTDSAEIVSTALRPESRTESPQNARKIIMRDDGTALLISSGAARLFVP